MKTLKKYKIQYYFDGRGEVLVYAKDKKDAKNKFLDGHINSTTEKEWIESYNIDKIKEVDLKEMVFTSYIKERLEYLKKQIKEENISYEEIAELQSLAKYIDKEDIELLEWAGVEEKTN